LPEYKERLSGSFLDRLQADWTRVGHNVSGLPPTMEDALARLGETGATVLRLKRTHDEVIQYSDNYPALAQQLVPTGATPRGNPPGETRWSRINERVYGRFTTNGNYMTPGRLELRVLPRRVGHEHPPVFASIAITTGMLAQGGDTFAVDVTGTAANPLNPGVQTLSMAPIAIIAQAEPNAQPSVPVRSYPQASATAAPSPRPSYLTGSVSANQGGPSNNPLWGGVAATLPTDCKWDLWAHRIADEIAKNYHPNVPSNLPFHASFSYTVLAPGRWTIGGKLMNTPQYTIHMGAWNEDAIPPGDYGYSSAEINAFERTFANQAAAAINALNKRPDILRFPPGTNVVSYPKRADFWANDPTRPPVEYGPNPCDALLQSKGLLQD
jgi:hypothetical protein